MNILFIGLNYHGYTSAICDEMRRRGAEVQYVDIQPRSAFFKLFRTLTRSAYDAFVEQAHLEAIRSSSSRRFDKVVFLQAHQMSLANLQKLRSSQPAAEFVLYNWDSISTHDYRPQSVIFDRVLTFDRKDSEEHGFGYLPLFCQRPLQGLEPNRSPEGTAFMVGNVVKPARYFAVKQFRTYCEQNGLTFRQHLKISPVVWAQLARSGEVPRGVTFKAIELASFAVLVQSSSAAFDYANHSQSGQTMRMMESLCGGKKIITNNSWVRREPFYSPDRIHVFESTRFEGVAEFLKAPLNAPSRTFPEYHIQSFVGQLLGQDPLLSDAY